jgi:hypothetical protein
MIYDWEITMGMYWLPKMRQWFYKVTPVYRSILECANFNLHLKCIVWNVPSFFISRNDISKCWIEGIKSNHHVSRRRIPTVEPLTLITSYVTMYMLINPGYMTNDDACKRIAKISSRYNACSLTLQFFWANQTHSKH